MENGRQKTKESIIPRGKFRPVENGPNNGEIIEVRIEWTLKKYKNEMRVDKTRAKLTQTALITPTSIHTIKTKHQNTV